MEALQLLANGITRNGLVQNGGTKLTGGIENSDGEFEVRDLQDLETRVSFICSSISRFSGSLELKEIADRGVDNFYVLVKEWSRASLDDIAHVLDLMEYVEDAALGAPSLELVERQAVKDMIDIGDTCQGLRKNIEALSSSVDLALRPTHFWKFWNTKILPAQKNLSRQVRKYRIAIAGL